VNKFASRIYGGNMLASIGDDESYSLVLFFDDFHTVQEFDEILSVPEAVNILEGRRLHFSTEDVSKGFLILFTSTTPTNNASIEVQKLLMVDKAQYFHSRGLKVAVLSINLGENYLLAKV